MLDKSFESTDPDNKLYGLTGLELSVDAVLADLARLDALRREHEAAKLQLVGGNEPVSDETYLRWLHETYGNEVDFAEHPELHRCDDLTFMIVDAENLLKERLHYWQQKLLPKLTQLFPALRGAPGTDPFDESVFSTWLQSETNPHAVHAGSLVLSIWFREPDRFNLMEAFAGWDDEHREAYVEWLNLPIMPQRELWGRF